MTSISVRDAADALGIETYDLAEELYSTIAGRLAGLGISLRQRGFGLEGQLDGFDGTTAAIRRCLVAAVACDRDWQAEGGDGS